MNHRRETVSAGGKLGMSEYADRFAENRIDLSVLPDLTDQDLEKLGVVLGELLASSAQNLGSCAQQ